MDTQARINAAVLELTAAITAAVLEGSGASPPQSKRLDRWLPASEALEVLAGATPPVTRAKLFHRKTAGIYREGSHYRDIAAKGSQRPTYEWNVDAIMNLTEIKARRYR